MYERTDKVRRHHFYLYSIAEFTEFSIIAAIEPILFLFPVEAIRQIENLSEPYRDDGGKNFNKL